MILRHLSVLVGAVGRVGGPDPESCDEFHPAGTPAGMRVMIERGRLTRITLARDAPMKTEHGFGVGDTAAEIKASLGARAIATRHEYGEAPSEYLMVWIRPTTDPEPRGIVYEIGADGRVAQVHAEGASIQNVEGVPLGGREPTHSQAHARPHGRR